MKAKQHNDFLPLFSSMLREALGNRLDTDADTFVEMMAPDGVMDFPFAPAGFATRLKGRSTIASHLQNVASLIAFDRFSAPTVHHTQNDEVTILEFTCVGRVVKTKMPYNQRYISVITTRSGRITHFADYWNPLVITETFGDLKPLKGALDA